MPSNYLILCQPLLLLPSISPSIRVFSNESVSSHQVAKVRLQFFRIFGGIFLYIHAVSFHSFIQQVYIECLICTRGYSRKWAKFLLEKNVSFIRGKQTINWKKKIGRIHIDSSISTALATVLQISLIFGFIEDRFSYFLLHSICCGLLFWSKYMKKIYSCRDMFLEKGSVFRL